MLWSALAEPAAAEEIPVLDEIVMVNSSGIETTFQVTAETSSTFSAGEVGASFTEPETTITVPDAALNAPDATAMVPTDEPVATIAPRVIIGPDNRVTMNTRTGVGRHIPYLTFTFPTGQYRCSGALVGPSTIVTAAHCLHNVEEGGWVTSAISAYFGVQGSEATHACSSVDFVVPNAWITTNNNPIHDFGIIQLGCAHSALNYGWMGYRDAGTGTVTGTNWNVSGYPGELPGIMLWNDTGSLGNSANANTRFRYIMDTTGGQSGGPLWRQESGSGCTVCVVGVHTSGFRNANDQPVYNEGSRMTGLFKAAVDGYTGFGG